MGFVIAVNTPTNSIFIFATPTGKPFRSQRAAERAKKKVEERLGYKINGAVVVPLESYL